jgi:mRNA-degrading endonuclease RelE of RelBE toxin-antitoxin system
MNSKTSWVLQIDPAIFKYLKRMPRGDVERILFIIQNLPLNPFSGDIQKMRDEKNIWRRRVGAYRIFYELIPQSKIISVFRVERRTSKTY